VWKQNVLSLKQIQVWDYRTTIRILSRAQGFKDKEEADPVVVL
jgi:hypothetical protein